MPTHTWSDKPLAGRRVVLGVTGSIACYKAADIASKLTQTGAEVDVILTPSAQQFITPLTFRALTGRAVYTDMFDPQSPIAEEHVMLARAADAVLVAPASATTIGRLAHGLADNMVALTYLATNAPTILAPAMDAQMWNHDAVQANIAILRDRGVTIVGPAEGRLASGHLGLGRLVKTDILVGAVRTAIGATGDLAGMRVVVSAGGTQEPLDPVRYIGNRSSGKMGMAIAEAARDRGARVRLICGPIGLATPYGIDRIDVKTTADMADAVRGAVVGADALIMAAAPADFRPAAVAEHKIKRTGETLSVDLVANADILATTNGPFVKVGFAAETQQLREHAAAKITKKGLDFIVANDVTAAGAGFGHETNRVTIMDAAGGVEELPLMSKYEVGHQILDRVAAIWRRARP